MLPLFIGVLIYFASLPLAVIFNSQKIWLAGLVLFFIMTCRSIYGVYHE